jgi:hypothetical protein
MTNRLAGDEVEAMLGRGGKLLPEKNGATAIGQRRGRDSNLPALDTSKLQKPRIFQAFRVFPRSLFLSRSQVWGQIGGSDDPALGLRRLPPPHGSFPILSEVLYGLARTAW